MKYKQHIATGALAISLLVSGSSVFAATPQDLGIKNTHQTYQKQNKNNKNLKIKKTGKSNVIGTVGAINETGFTIEVKNIKTKITSSIEVKIGTTTVYSKNGIKVTRADIVVGQKIIIVGDLDKTTNIITAKTIKIVK
jgi:hypothetical protein